MKLNKTAQNRLVKAAGGMGEGFYDRGGALSELDSEPLPQYNATPKKSRLSDFGKTVQSGGIAVTLTPEGGIGVELNAEYLTQ